MKASEKIFLYPYSTDGMYEVETKPLEGTVEYTRTDAFIEKACEWIKEFNNHHYIMRYSDSCEPPLSEVTEWFKNYMKGEKV